MTVSNFQYYFVQFSSMVGSIATPFRRSHTEKLPLGCVFVTRGFDFFLGRVQSVKIAISKKLFHVSQSNAFFLPVYIRSKLLPCETFELLSCCVLRWDFVLCILLNVKHFRKLYNIENYFSTSDELHVFRFDVCYVWFA